MEVMHPYCAGLDIHKQTVNACILTPGRGAKPTRQSRAFGTMTADLLALGDWLAEAGVTHVAMESTGVYWKPIWNLLEERFTLLLVNAQHVKAVPGRKSDVRDCEWLATLLRHGLVRASFVPERPARELRELTRYRSSLVRERTAEINRLAKTLEGANIKLGSVVSELTGKSARAMLAQLVAGEDDPAVLADLAHGRLREKRERLVQALTGRVGDHQRFLVAQQLAHIDFLDEQIATLSVAIAERLRPFEGLIALLDSIPGIGRWSAEVILAEIGRDMTRFPSARHLAKWAGMCPGDDESAGKRRSGKTGHGSSWLKVTLTEAAYAAGRGKGTALSVRYHQLVRRRGKKKAAVAIGHQILTIVYAVLTTGQPYDDARAQPRQTATRRTRERRLIRELEQLGNRVILEPLVA
jgi:transposase